MSQRQLNIRLADKDIAVLEAASFLQAHPLPDLVRSVLLDRVAALSADPLVQQALRLRAEDAAIKEGKVTPLKRRRAPATTNDA